MDRLRQSFYYLFVTTKVHKVNRAKMNKVTAGLIVLAPVVQRLDSAIHWIVIYPVNSVIQPLNNRGLVYIGSSLPFGDGSIKSCAQVLHHVSITVVKKLKFYCRFCLHYTTEHTQRLRHGGVGQPGPRYV